MHRTENLFNNAGRNAHVSNLLSFGLISIVTLMCCVLGSCLASLMALSLEIMSPPDVIFGIDDLTKKLLIRKLVFHEMMVSDKTASWKLFNREEKNNKVEIKILEGFKGMHPSIKKD